ncbi:MAG: hypothetical protein RLZZ271_874, partial [Pseudomonadota bacterium]
ACFHEIEGRHGEAVVFMDRLLAKDPRNIEALQQKILALYSMRSYAAAASCARMAVEYHPKAANVWNLLGSSLQGTGQMEEAETAFLKSLELKPDFVHPLGNLGCIYREKARIQEAVECFDRVLAIKPDDINSRANRLYCMSYLEGTDPLQYIEEARHSDLVLNSDVKAFSQWKAGKPGDAVEGKLRVGFVSGDFLRHPVGFFLETTLKHLDQSKFELFAYPTNTYEDELTKRIKPCFSQWLPIKGMTDARAAQRIHDDGLHLLIDLAGFSAGNRLSIFPYKAAPVQATWLGFFASTGMRSIDYILVDPHGVRPDEQHLFSEKLCFLPETRLCFTPPTDKPVSTLPALTAGHVNMACYQDVTKLNTRVLDCWRRILEALPECRFVMMSRQNKDPVFRQSLRERLQEAGLDVDRVHIQEPLTYSEYLESYSKIDFMLDTFPYTGGTTTCEALWMGVPTVTLCGHTLLARQGAGLLACAGLNDWVANSEDEYVALAVKKAGDVQALARTRATLREMAAKTSLFDGQRFAAQLGAAFEAMWRGEV